jgi:hypothetical protein
VTTTLRLTPVIGVQRSSSETVPHPEPEPIFTELGADEAVVGGGAPSYRPALPPSPPRPAA